MAAMLLAPLGCQDEGGPHGSSYASGELGLAAFRWVCAGEGDLACETEAFSRDVAFDSVFELSYGLSDNLPEDVDQGWLEIAGRLRVAEVGSGRFRATDTGRVMAIAISDVGHVIDYTSIDISRVDDVSLIRGDTVPQCDPDYDEDCEVDPDPPTGPLSFVVGEQTRVRAQVRNASGALLMGRLDYSWSVGPPGVATVDLYDGHEILVDVIGSGTIEITVTVAGITRTFYYRTTGSGDGPRRNRPSPPDETDTDTDGDTEGTGTTGETEGTGTSGTDTDTEGGSGSSSTGGMQ